MKEQSNIKKALFKSAAYKLSLKHLVRRRYVNGPSDLAKYIKFYDKTIVSNDIWECITLFDQKNANLTAQTKVSHKKRKNKSKKQPKNSISDDFLRSFEWRKLRMEVLKKYGATCQCCGATRHTGAVINVVLIIARNIKKERETEVIGIADNTVPDAALIVVKQRHGDFQGSFKLWFDVRNQQFKEDAFEPPKKYLEE